MCVACNNPVAIVWHEYDKSDKKALRAEVFHREKVAKVAVGLDDSVSFKTAFVNEATRLYQEALDDYNKLVKGEFNG